MKYLRRMMSFLAVRLIVFTVCASVVVCAFYMAFEIGNAYVLISEGMEKRVSVALTRENATDLNGYFTTGFLEGDPVLSAAFSEDSPYLAYTITSKIEFASYFLQTLFVASNTIAVAEDLAFTFLENGAENALQLLAHRLEINMLVCSAVIARCHYVNHCIVVIITTEWSINTHVMVVGLDGLVDFGFLHLGNLAQLCYRWLALVFLFELADFGADLAQCTYLVQRQANDTALLSDSLEYALANPPYCV